MKLLEHEAKTILGRNNVPVPESQLITMQFTPELTVPVVLKSQVPVGGRGKAGGVVVVTSQDEMTSTIQRIFALDIKGFRPQAILAEEVIAIDKEFYLALLINRSTASIELMAHTSGGVEVEDNAEESFLSLVVGGQELVGGSSYVVDGSWDVVGSGESNNSKWKNGGTGWDVVGQQLAEFFDLPGQTFVLQDLLQNLHHAFIEQDMTLLEINPLILSKSGKLVAGDCKMELDDAAQFRHTDWDFEAPKANANFVTLDETGSVATIANGAGLAMATVDAVADFGMTPANFLDIGGGANEASVTAAFETIMRYEHIQAIIINIFAGITRCDEVARAIVAAKQNIANLPPLFIRLTGTNSEEAKVILNEADVPLLDTLPACLSAAKEVLR